MADNNTDATNQERQKTVIAFVAGLLIGGLLVWVFTSSGAGTPADDTVLNGDDDTLMEDDDSDEVEDDDDSMMVDDSDTDNGDTTPTTPAPEPDGEGSLDVDDQAAGNSVSLSDVEYPTTGGWIVVKDGDGSGILGAARYDTSVGLTPDSVTLLRATEAGSDYMVVFYSTDGNRSFDTSTDVEMEGTATATFTAE